MTIEVDSSSATEAVIVMRRMLDAPREVVWAALTDPKHVVRWYGGRGFENPVCEIDLRPGGRWRHVMRTPDGTEYPMELEFVEVVPPEKLVWKRADDGKPSPGGPHDNVMTVTLEAVGNRTRWQLVTRFRSFADRAEALEIGFTTVLGEGVDKLGAVLAELLRGAR